MPEPQWRLLTGDAFLCARALEKRCAALEAIDPDAERIVQFADELQLPALENELRSVSLFSSTRHVVIRRCEKLRAAKALVAVLEKPLPQGTYLTLMAGTLKSTSLLVKAARARDVLVQLAAPKRNALAGLAKEILGHAGVQPTQPILRLFLARCGSDLTAMEQEARKLAMIADEGVVAPVLAEVVLFNHTETTVYPFYDRVGEGNLQGALQELASLREDAGRIVGGVIRHLTRLTMIRVLMDQRTPMLEIASKTGIQNWLCKRLATQARQRPLEALASALRTGIQMDTQIKQGRIAPLDALMNLLFVATAPARRGRG